ncbi:microtubule-actin cross-linking factor 1 isoform X8 [Folsomia candida]|uniref:microtubule-actin cross-linking factor 1 isoform X8 n=1 Tax=Folsomia candida TaxID=158441 RepID=UPI001604DF0E|nr:microtubule-actin cross-linking factor 1 isoform X8 [Folsomia candida]
MEFDQSLEEWAKQKPLSILQLDSADRAVLRIADERDAIQKKTFTKWVNKHLSKDWRKSQTYTCFHVCKRSCNCDTVSCGKRVGDLFEDLRDGHNLVSLLEVLASEHLPRERGRMRFHMLQNVQTVLDFLRYRKIKLVNIRAEDIVDGNPKLTLGLIWTIILHFQISEIVVGMEENVSAKEALLAWAKKSTAKYPGVRVGDFTKSWKDGLAFCALLNRNRPDLIDWRSVTRRSARERLETAFNVAERDCGVVKLLDPEDVDTNEPDEKSIITYISSLYDAFPEPPRLHPLYDTESQKKWEEYREIATSLYTWIRQNVNNMQDRHFSTSLIEMRKMAAEMNRFRVEEVPSRGHDKQRLAHLFRDAEKHFRDGELDRELHMENIERQWQLLMLAHQEKDQAIHEEIKKLEKLQRLAEKIHREGKQVEIRLDEIEQRIDEEARRIDRLHPLDAKHNCDQLERDMQMTEDTIKSMFTDTQTLKDARFHQASEVQKMVQHLHQRWISIRSLLHNRLLSVLASISFPIEEKSVTRTSKTVMETRLVETNQHFRTLQEVGDWIKQKQKSLHDSDFGSDLPSVQAELEKQLREHRTIEKFQSSVDKCSTSKSSFHGEELQLYINYLNTIQKSYSELLMSSRKRQSDLETLSDFVQSATNELMWLSEKEEREITRDWSSKNINLVEVEQYYESLMCELEKREIQFNAVQDRGESLVLQHHPASKCIETYMSAMQTQWAWLLQLTICLETHLKHVATYQQYFSDIRECEQTVARKEEMLNTVYSKSEFSLDEGEMLLKEMQDMREDLTKYGDIITSVSNQSRDIIPLKQRKTNVSRPIIVTAICNYKQNNQQMVINKDERCTLTDNSQRVRWRITNSSGLEGMVPGVCFVIPPPDNEALDAADRLRRQYDRTVTMWQKKQLKMRQNMIFATIKVVKSWDLSQFLAMGAEQRNAIRKALNEDAEKLIQEGDPSDPALRRLRREIDEVNRLFDEFERKAMESEKTKTASKNFTEQVTILHQDLEDLERNIVSRANAPIPKDVDSLSRLVVEHREFEMKIHTFESRVQTMQRNYATMPQKTASVQAKVEKVVEKWERVWSLSNLYVERLKSVEIVLNSMEETKTHVSQFEMKLASYENLPTDDDGIKRVSNDLYNLQNTAQAHQHTVDRMVDNTKIVRQKVEKSRPSQKRHTDIEKLEDEVHRVSSRWTSTCSEIVERINTVQITSEHASRYNTSYSKEMNWLDSVDSKTKSLPLVEGSGAKRKINPHMTLYNSVIEEKITIEQVNTMGARLAKEAKRYDSIVDTYRETMEETHPSLNANLVKKAKVQSAEEVIFRELDLLNLKYQLTVDNLYHRLQQLAIIYRQVVATQEDTSFEMPIVPAPSPIKTYRIHAQREATSPLNDLLQSEDTVDFVQQKSSANITLTPAKGPTTKKLSVMGVKNGNGHTNGEKEGSGDGMLGGASLRFTEIRSAKIIEKVEEGISTETTTVYGIIDPSTGDSLTLSQAIGCGLVDIKTGEFVDPRTNKRITLQEATELGYIESGILHKLMGLCGLVDPQTGEELTFLEAIRKGYYDLSKGVFIHPQTGEPITTEQAIRLGLSTKHKESMPGGSISATCDRPFLPSDYFPVSTTLVGEQHTSDISTDAHVIAPSSIRSSDMIGNPISLDLSLSSDVLISVPPPTTHQNPTLTQLVQAGGVIDPKTGVINVGKLKEMSENVTTEEKTVHLTEAVEQGLISVQTAEHSSPAGHGLSELFEQDLVSLISTNPNDGDDNVPQVKILDRFSGKQLSLEESIHAGILNPFVTEVYHPEEKKRITVVEAINDEIIDPETGVWNKSEPLSSAYSSQLIRKPISLKDACDSDLVKEYYLGESTTEVAFSSIIDPITRVDQTILESMAAGNLDVTSKTVTDSSTEKLVSLEEALAKGIITPSGSVVVDAKLGTLVPLKAASKQGLLSTVVRTSIFDIPCVTDPTEASVPISLTEALEKQLIDPHTTPQSNSLNISSQILPILNSPSGIWEKEDPTSQVRSEMSVLEAITKQKLLPSGKISTGESVSPPIPINMAVEEGLLDPEKAEFLKGLYSINLTTANVTTTEKHLVTVHSQEIKSTFQYMDVPAVPELVSSSDEYSSVVSLQTQQPITDEMTKVRSSPSSQDQFQSELQTQKPSSEENVIDRRLLKIPADGWSLEDALGNPLFDSNAGLFTIPGTDRQMTFEECIHLKIIDPTSAEIVDQKRKRRTSIIRGIEKQVINSTGHYQGHTPDTKNLSLADSISRGLILLKVDPKISTTTTGPDLASSDKTELVESTLENFPTTTGTLLPSEISQSLSQQHPDELVINAVLQGEVDPTLVIIKDKDGNNLTAQEAIDRGHLDKNTGSVKVDGQTISVKDALKLGALAIAAAPALGVKAVYDSLASKIANEKACQKQVELGLVHDDDDPRESETSGIETALQPEILTSAHSLLLTQSDPMQIHKIIKSTDKIGVEKIGEDQFAKSEQQPETVERVLSSGTATPAAGELLHQEPAPTDISAPASSEGSSQPSSCPLPPPTFVDSVPIEKSEPSTTSMPLNNRSSSDATQVGVVISEQVIPLESVYTTTTTTTTTTVIITKISRHKVPITELISSGMVDSKTAAILSAPENFIGPDGKKIDLKEAIQLGKIDGNSGAILDPDSQQLLTINEAVIKNLLDDEANVLLPVGRSVTVPELKSQGLFDPKEQKIIHPETGDNLTMSEAISSQVLFGQSAVTDPVSKKRMSLTDALTKNIVSNETGGVTGKDGKEIPLIQALESGTYEDMPHPMENYMNPVAMTMPTAVMLGLVDPEKGTMTNISTGEKTLISQAVQQGKIMMTSPEDSDLTNYTIPHLADSNLTTDEKMQREILLATKEKVVLSPVIESSIPSHTSTLPGTTNLSVKLKESPPKSPQKKVVSPPPSPPIETLSATAVAQSLDPSLLVIDPRTGKEAPLGNVLQEGVNPDAIQITNPASSESISLKEAVGLGVLAVLGAPLAAGALIADAIQGKNKGSKQGGEQIQTIQIKTTATKPAIETVKQQDDEDLGDDDDDDDFGHMSKPFPLNIAVAKGKYNPETGLVHLEDTNEFVALDEAIKRNEIDAHALTCKDPRNEQLITLEKAIETGIMNPKTGHVVDPVTGANISLDVALESGLLIKPTKKISLPDALYGDRYDPATNTFVNSSGESVPLKSAIDNKEINLNTTLVKNFATESVIPFRTAMAEDIVDVNSGLVKISPSEMVNIRDAIETGVIIEVRQPLSLSEMFMKGLHTDGKSRPFMHPVTGKYITLAEALSEKVIDSDSMHVKDTREGFAKKMPLQVAIQEGFMSGDDGSVQDFGKNVKLSLTEAVDSGLVIDSRRPISLQKCLHLGLYSEDSGRMTDPNSGKSITLHEGIRRLVVNPNLPCVWNEEEAKILSLVETCRVGIIDRQEGLFNLSLPQTTTQATEVPSLAADETGATVPFPEKISLAQALEEKHILDIEKPFGLYQALKIGLYDKKTGKFVHPSTGKYLTLEDSCKEDLIDPNTSVVKSSMDSKLLRLPVAVNLGVVDPVGGLFRLGDSSLSSKSKGIPLDQARIDGYVLTTDRPLSIVDAVQEHLYNSKTGKIADTLLGEWLTPKNAVQQGLIDPMTSAVQNLRNQNIKSLNAAIDDGDIENDRGLVTDARNGKPTTFNRAVEQGILVKVPKPISFSKAIHSDFIDLKRGTFCDPRTSITSPLQIAITHELIEPGSAVVKHPETDAYINLREATQIGLVSLNRRALIDPSTLKLKPLCIIFDQGTVVFLRESVSFDVARDKGLLNLKTGKFIDPNASDTLPMTIKEAIDIHAINPNSAVIKDTLKKRLLKLSDAFNAALIDPNSSTVIDTATNHAIPLEQAIASGLLLTPRNPFGLLEALDFSMYDPVSGKFSDPYTEAGDCKLSLNQCIAKNLIEQSTTMVKAPSSGKILPLSEAIAANIVDGESGYFLDTSTGTRHNLLDAWKRGWLLPAEARLAIEAQYAQCDATINNLTNWLNDIERRLASQESLRETVEEIKKQTMTVKQIRDDVEDHSQMVLTCLDQVRHLVATGGDVLSSEEINTLEKNGKILKTRFDCVSNYSESLFRQLTTASDELKKYKAEVSTFKTWMDKSIRTLEEKERNLSNLSASGRDNTKEFVSDVIAHQGDLRFITMSAQKFIEESREYLQTLNTFRTNLPQRLPYLEVKESSIKHEVTQITTVYQDLLARANRLFDKLSQLGNKQKDFQDALNKAMAWLKEVTPRVQKVLSEPIAGEPRLVEDQLSRAKALQSEILSNGKLIEAVRQATNNLLNSMEELSPSERDAVERTTSELESKYKNLLDAVGDKIKDLDTALVQSQGLQDAVEGVSNWLTQAEYQLKNINKPASLIRERLDEQIREVKMLQADIDSHRPSIESMARSADDLLRTRNATVSKKVEAKLKDVLSRYEKLVEKLVQRSVFLHEVSTHLDSFLLNANHFENWFSEMFETLETRLTGDDAMAKLDELMRRKDSKKHDFDETISSGKSLVSKKDVTDTSPVKDKIKALENQWRDLTGSLDEKSKLGKTRVEALNAYEKLRDQVQKWLTSMESRVNSFQSVAVDVELIKQQEIELKPLVKEHRDYNPTIDKVNELGNAYDALTRGDRSDSPRRKVSSPVKRPSMRSTDTRSPSPSKTLGVDRSPMSPSGSSGFGSRRSSQEGFLNLEDSSPVQQQLNEINHRYNLIGMKLTDRQTELDSTREEVRKIADNLKALAQFLDKTERSLPKDAIPQSRDEADKMLKTIKSILEDMYDKQGMLDNTRTLITDLLRRKPNVPGAESLKDAFDGISQRWKDLQDKCKRRVGFLEHIKEFHDSHDNLHGWLNAKDKMLAVLGPISSDPRMVQSQMQQVQVMRDEFRNQKPILDSFNNAGDNILTQTSPDSPDGRKIEDKLASINQRWNDLLHKLDEREGNLDAASNASQDFFNNLNKLQDNLHKISDDLDDLIADKGDPEEMLKKLEAIERNLNSQRPILADVEAAGAELCDILQDPGAKADIKQKLAQVGRLFNQCQKKLDNCKAELENSKKDVIDFNDACEAAQDWLADMLSHLSDKLLVSADRDILRGQVGEFEPIYKQIMSKEHEIIMTLNKGKELMAKSTRKPEQRTIQTNMEKVQKGWDKLKKEAVDRHNRLQTCNEHCKKYDKTREPFLNWLAGAEDKFEKFRLTSYKKPDIDKLLKEVNGFKNDLWRHSGEYESTRGFGETFVGACDKDKDGVKNELQEMKQRWEALNNAILAKIQELEDAAAKLNAFNEDCRDLKNALNRCDDKLASHDSMGDAAKDPKLLQRIKAIQDEVRKLEKPLDNVRQQGEGLSIDANRNNCDDAHIRDAVDDLMDRFDNLNSKLGDRFNQAESAQRAMEEFKNLMKGLSADIGDLENELNAMKPIGRDIPTVKSQIHEIEVFREKLEDKKADLAGAASALEELIRQGVAADPKGMKDQIDGLRKLLAKLEDKSKQRDSELQKTLARLEGFYDLYNSTDDMIDDLIQQEKSFSKTVGGDVASIRAQQAQFKEFRTRYVDAVAKKVEECNKTGQGLIQSASSGVNTSGLEKDLEKMNDKWNALKERINEQERKLDVALLQSGKFKEALDGLDKWLSEMEDLVANQKPPSADAKVVKAQLQEQKFLNKMLLDRQPSVTSLFQMGKEIAANADPAEKHEIEGQMNNMKDRYGNLCDGARDRQGLLEDVMKVAKAFLDKFGPLSDWLDKQGKKLKDMSLIPTDEDKIARRIKEHDAFHDGLLKKQPDFSELAELAQTLMNLVGDEDAAGVADSLQDLTDRYGRLIEESEGLGNLLRQAKAGLRNLVLSYEELVAWMDTVEKRLAKYKVVAVHKDKLIEQMQQLATITEEIKDREKQVDDTVEAGLDLMKNISNDEAIQLKDKLDSLQRRFHNITTKAADLLKTAQEALPLVTQFHECHLNLSDWMAEAENILKGLDNSNLIAQEKVIVRLEAEIVEQRKVLEIINLVGPQLCQLSPGEGASTIEGLVTRDNRRFDAICEQVQRRAERIQMAKARSMEVLSDIDDLLDWFREIEGQLRDAEKPSCEPDVVRVQLQEHRTLNDEINSQKGRVREVLATAKKVLREATQGEDTATLREKAEDLKETMETVSKLSSDRLNALEQALPLAEHFFDTHIDLNQWMDAMEDEISILDTPALRPDQIVKLQEKTQAFIQSLTEHKPLLDKLNKTGGALIKLCNNDDAGKVDEIMHADNERYNALRVALRDKQQALEKALQETSQFKDKLDGMLNALENTADQCKNAEPISAHPEKIRDQIGDNDAIIDDVKKREDAFNSVKKQAADIIDKAPNKNDPAVRDIKQKLDRLNSLWDQIQKLTKQRGKNLDEALALAEKFWEQLQAILDKLDILSETLKNQEPPAVEPKAIQKQQEALKEIKKDIEKVKPEVNNCRQSGQKLLQVVGEQDKPEISKNIHELDAAWDNITALFAKREENLIDAMEKAMEFHETLQELLRFLDKAEARLAGFGVIGADIEAVKKQIKELKDFKGDVDPMMVKVEALNRTLRRQAQELTERTSPDQAAKIKGPLAQVNRRWDDLLKGIVDRQRELENALLRLGQFQHALNELMAWMEKTNKNLDTLKPVYGDPQVIEIELAKLKVLVNDIQAHQVSVDTLNDAGRQIIESERGSDNAAKIQQKLNDMNKKWADLQKKANDRQKELEDALREAQAFNAEIQDLLMWLNDVDAALNTSKPVGGLPETAQEQLNRFMEIFNELEANRPKVEAILHQGQEYLKKSTEGSATNLQHNLRTLRQRWESVMNRANDKKIKLEIALKEAMEFHKACQDFIDWLTEAERYLTGLEPVSRVLDKVVEQVESHKEFQKEVSAHREVMLNLEKKGNHLKYFSQKQDVILIKNLLISVQHRWDRVVSKSTERVRLLDLGFKEAKEFHDSWTSLMNWLDEADKNLEEITATAGQNPVKIKQMLAKHKEFQRALAAKQPAYDSTMKNGKTLKDKAPKPDEPILRQMLTDLKNKWNAICNKSVEKQRNLEQALLRSGQFKDALQELLDWLKDMDRLIVDDGPVHGDLDTVTALIDAHSKIEEEVNNRRSQINDIIRTAEEMMETAQPDEKAKLQSQVKEIKTSYDKIKKKCETRSRRLEEALKEAEKLHKAVHMLLEWLSDAEMKLRFAGQLPEDEETTKRLLDEQEAFMKELKLKEREKDETIELAKSILAKAHPDAIPVIKHWISIIQSRWDEISSWAVQRQQKLQAHLNALRGMEEMLEELMAWLKKCEDTLTQLEAEPLPDDMAEILVLIKEHKGFMEGMASRQPEIDAVCKPKLVSRQPMVKGKPGPRLRSTTPGGESREASPELDFAQRRLSAKTVGGSRESTPMSRMESPGREDLFPHIGPRFDRRGSKAVEPQIKNPRVKALWDKWKVVWMMAWERQRRLQDKFNYLQELEKVKNFSWEDWRKRFLRFMNNKKSRVMDLFRKIDKNNDNLIPREEFIDAIMKTKFPTSRLEMNAVADMFDHGDHLIDYMEFIAALRADWEDRKPMSEGDVIEDEIQRQVMKCTCRQKFRVFQVGEGKYRFGESQKLRLVRILRSTVMVRVGGGWVALDEFLVKNDPCRVVLMVPELMGLTMGHEQSCPSYGYGSPCRSCISKGRTNIELREQFILADGVSQTMTAFKSKPSGSTISSGNRSAQSLPAAGPITKVKERSIRSVPMGQRARSTDRTTPESTYSDDGFSLSRPPRRSSTGPGRGSQPGSRSGSKPPSRTGSNASLDSTDDYGTRIPVRRSASLKRGTSGSTFGSRGPLATSTPSRPAFSLSTNLNGSRGPSTERAHSFTRPSSATPMKRTGSASSISSLTNSAGRPSRIPLYVGGETGSGEISLDRSRTPSNSNIPVAVSHQTPRTPSGGSNVSFSLSGTAGAAATSSTSATTERGPGGTTRTATSDSATKSSYSTQSRSSFQEE